MQVELNADSYDFDPKLHRSQFGDVSIQLLSDHFPVCIGVSTRNLQELQHLSSSLAGLVEQLEEVIVDLEVDQEIERNKRRIQYNLLAREREKVKNASSKYEKGEELSQLVA